MNRLNLFNYGRQIVSPNPNRFNSYSTKRDTMSCLLISGYRLHGKDTFFQNLKSGNCITDLYDVYLNEDSYISCLEIFTHKPERYRRVAFADALKTSLAELFDIEVYELDSLKTSQMSIEHIQKYPRKLVDNPIYRDAMIDLGLYMRKTVGDWCWASLAASNVKLDQKEIPIITDFRFPSELQYAEYIKKRPITLRLHRSDAEIPPLEDESEHSLDRFPFDFMVVPTGEKLHQLYNGCTYHKVC